MINLLVKTDSLQLLAGQPEEIVSQLEMDTFALARGERLAVSNQCVVPNDSIDSLWMEVADEQARFGWLRRSELMRSTVPDDPISLFINTFSNIHTKIFLAIVVMMIGLYILTEKQHRHVPVVHWRDIPTPYPALLCTMVALSATLYGTIQHFFADQWQAFYYSPTLNPFAQPPLLATFLSCVWAIIILAVATVDEVRRLLHFAPALLYLGSVAAVCAANYLVFSLTTPFYIGYILLIAYIFFAIKLAKTR